MRFAFARAAVRSFILAFMAKDLTSGEIGQPLELTFLDNRNQQRVLVLSLDSGIFLGLTSPSNIDHYPIGSATSKP